MNGGAAGTAVMKAAPPQRITPTGEAAAAWESPSTPAHAFPETSEATAVAAATATATTAVANTNPRSSSCVQVAVRVRPVLPWEKKECVCKVHPESSSIQIAGAAGPRFTFDRVFSPSTTQAALFTAAVQPLVDKCLEGYNATIFAYGQTGSGKTHTILGPADSWMSYEGSASSVEEEEEDAAAAGVLPRALHALFQALQAEAAQDPCFTYSVTLQFLEVYGEDLRDLLAPRTSSGASKLTVREYNDEPEVPGALAIPCPTALDATRAVQAGSLRRVTAATAMNATSSRSHALLTVALEQGWGEDRHSGLATTKRSKFHFCDLAGSERQKRTLSTGQRLKEGIEINKGLLVLGNVISSLASNSSHVPYRDSKLTRLLRGSLGGNHQTLMMACVSPAPENMDESLNCLRYANRAKNIQNSAIVNLDAASRRLLELQQQIVALAQSLLVVVPSSSDKPWTVQQHQAALAQISYSRNDLEVLVEGGSASVVGIDKTLSSLTPLKSGSIHNSSTPGAEHSAVATPAAPTPWTSHSADHRSRPSTSLRGLHDTMDRDRPYDWEERISAMEHELHRTQALLRESQENHDVAEMELYQYRARERLNVQPHEKENDVSERFVEQATAYEQEIAILHKELQKAERKANRLMMWQTVDPRDDEKLLGDAKKRLGDAEDNLTQDRLRLQQLQSTPAAESLEASGQLTVKPSTSMATSSSSESLDEEEHAEQAILQKWTKKYLVQGGHVDEDDETGHLVPNEETVHAASTEHKQLHMEADLVELTRSIEERENLIVDLKVSQEKYASMRTFYEEKLNLMESELKEKEVEREELLQQLESAKTRGSAKGLQERLKEKDDHIASLREKQKELKNLTRVSSRNESEISRLQNDVTDMKRKRVGLQKELTSERKRHLDDVKQLQKLTSQKEREINKLQKLSNQREVQAKKAGQVAKARLDEINMLRAKNKESEKRLRMQSVKKGLMEKAGIDSVLVGQRPKRTGKTTRRPPKSTGVDADALRALFDQKIAEVVRKETLADKLAEEWEEHYELTSRKQDLMTSSDSEAADDILSLSVNIKYKQDRIRQLAQRLGKPDHKDSRKGIGDKTHFELFDEQFEKLCRDATPDQAQKTLAKVLFGMVVRERRRTSTLARTASSLDEKLQQAERAVEGSEASLRSYMEEQRVHAAELSRSQQKNILSLMEMVKSDGAENGSADEKDELNHDDKKLIVLANERIAVLENQIQNLESDAGQNLAFRAEMENLRETYSKACQHRDQADGELRRTNRSLQEMDDYLVGLQSDQDASSTKREMEIVDDLLLQVRRTKSMQQLNHPSEGLANPLRVDGLDSSMDLSGIDEELAGDPDWAREIMEDLAFIAEGKIPPSLQNLPGFDEQVAQMENTSVFDRLTDPKNFTGTQKLNTKRRKPYGVSSRPKELAIDGQNPNMKSGLAEADAVAIVTETPTNAALSDEDDTTAKKAYKSVFDRLVSPSQATGTQRQRLVEKIQTQEPLDHNQIEDSRSAKSDDNEQFEKMLDDALGEFDELLDTAVNTEGSDVVRDRLPSHEDLHTESPAGKEKRHARNYSDYAEQDVFERLQRTSTVSYLNRHTVGTGSDVLPTDPLNHGRSGMAIQPSDDGAQMLDDLQTPYTRQNVFERLQKTTTEAYAKKRNRPKSGESHHDDKS